MPADEPMENARAAAEAREAVARRSDRGAGSTEDALKRYLASESFRERRREERDGEDAVADGQDEE
ncbi:hypothetical protein [Nocardioides sp. Soil805]|uniref:hypothetical protein n=1 Tax=Nocardioides sp. Soil805 TaxID=1736416 RepID=UPI0007032698|nr:hypothetical protein [Nocardioides sp. Soil805]KRF34151.1 hypothetical protein ASG94_15590 [Nocardioides sp. Soil805]